MDRNAMIVFGLPLWMIALLVCCMRVNIIIDFVIMVEIWFLKTTVVMEVSQKYPMIYSFEVR